MPNYSEWNYAIVRHFCQGRPKSSKVYLSVDEDTLALIGLGFSSSTNTTAVEDFKRAVQQKVVCGDKINLERIQGLDNKQTPQCIAFLGLCVLAAYYMANEEEISDSNYFKRLNQLLGVSQSCNSPRPQGMKFGSKAEEPLWQEWNSWLLRQGFQYSACQGKGHSNKFINYPISQCLLRQAEQNRLINLFAEKRWTIAWDSSTLFSQIKREAQHNGLASHLKKLVLSEPQRHEALAELIHEIHQQWLEQGCPTLDKIHHKGRIWSRNLFAGLYRTEEPFWGNVEYFLYPKQQRGRPLENLTLEYQNQNHQLRHDRDGWYLPLEEPLTAQHLEKGAKYPIIPNNSVEQLILPARDFWILISDPENPDSSSFASWGIPTLGTQFILLCKQELYKDLERLKDERLINWTDEPQPVHDNANWIELHQCMVISQAWDGIFIEHQELKDALQPTEKLSISLSGGLRVPNENGWIEGYLPEITIFGFTLKATLKVINLYTEQVVQENYVTTNQPILLETLERGTYRLQASFGQEAVEKYLRILSWSDLNFIQNKSKNLVPITDNFSLCGSILITQEITI
ncbi:hypothetical protein [Chroococcus sp. FPU101]|uniref:hypothetical protein n=1 Tax=Chroococcus sp. FPU101 TaxID=1974212 RepID=UPI001A8CC93F|nr:hypothetical protein [Chroococcus sp. FPU101]GFE71741.1 hypothetical protein CFPU101_43510 [Chroococcus sp. FPU101]